MCEVKNMKANILLYKNNLDFVLKRKFKFHKYNSSYRVLDIKIVYKVDYK